MPFVVMEKRTRGKQKRSIKKKVKNHENAEVNRKRILKKNKVLSMHDLETDTGEDRIAIREKVKKVLKERNKEIKSNIMRTVGTDTNQKRREKKAGYTAIQSRTVGQEQKGKNRSEFKDVTDGRTDGSTD